MTLAPISASWRTAVGPERARVRSITVNRSSGSVIVVRLFWGPRNGPQTPNARTRPGGAVTRLGLARSSSSLENGCALVDEGANALAGVLRVEAGVLGKGFELQGRAQIALGIPVDRSLGEPDGDGRPRRDLPRELQRRRHQLLRRHHAADQADAQRLRRVDHV